MRIFRIQKRICHKHGKFALLIVVLPTAFKIIGWSTSSMSRMFYCIKNFRVLTFQHTKGESKFPKLITPEFLARKHCMFLVSKLQRKYERPGPPEDDVDSTAGGGSGNNPAEM